MAMPCLLSESFWLDAEARGETYRDQANESACTAFTANRQTISSSDFEISHETYMFGWMLLSLVLVLAGGPVRY